MKSCSTILASFLLFGLPIQGQSSATSTTQISNLMTPWNDVGIGIIHAVTPDQRFGFSFTTGAGLAQLDSVVLEHIGYPGSLQSFGVELYRVDGYGMFGSVSVSFLGTLENSFVDPRPTQWPGQTTFVRYSSAANLSLDPHQSYMIAAVEPANGLNETGLLFAQSGNYSVFGDWSTTPPNQLFGDSSGLWMAGSMFGGYLKLEIDATPIPEPGSMAILIAGLIGLGKLRGGRR
jgi:hypothetical protein